MKPKSVLVSNDAISLFVSETVQSDPIVIITDPKTKETVCVVIGYLYGVPGYCFPVLHPDDKREFLVHHITYYYDVEEMLTHSHSSIRAEGAHWAQEEKANGETD